MTGNVGFIGFILKCLCKLGVLSRISPLWIRVEGTMCLVATLSVLEGLRSSIRPRQRSGKILMSDGGLQMEKLPAEAYGDRHPSVSITCIISPDKAKSLWGGGEACTDSRFCLCPVWSN